MTASSVWAPMAGEVAVVIDGERHAMSKGAGGWWERRADVSTGARYGFSIDNGTVLPDPRSLSQPDGVHGLSRVVDHAEHEWGDSTWTGLPLEAAVIYEMHVGTFTPDGTFDSAVEKLGHVAGLGVNVIEVMPVAAFPGRRGWGYDGVGLYAVHEAYGGPAAFKRFVDACHASGIAVVLDVVYNHLGPDGNYLGAYGPYFTDAHKTPWGQAVNFDGAGSDGVRDFVVDNARLWLTDYRVDGLRLDAVHAIYDSSAEHILQRIATEVHGMRAHLRRNVFVIAESNANDVRLVRPVEVGGYGLDATWSDDFHHSLHTTLTDESDGYYRDFGDAQALTKAISDVYVNDGSYSLFAQRHFGAPAGEVLRNRFVGYMQNHDQIGNRARGERSSALMSQGRARIAAALVLLGPFLPMLFQGEEWGATTPFFYFTDHEDTDLAKAVTEGRTHEFASFGWSADDVPDPQSEGTFRQSKLDWDEMTEPEHVAMLDWHRRLVALRRSAPDLSDGRPAQSWRSNDVVYMQRGRFSVVANIGSSAQQAEVGGDVVLASPGALSAMAGTTAIPTESVVVYMHPPLG